MPTLTPRSRPAVARQDVASHDVARHDVARSPVARLLSARQPVRPGPPPGREIAAIALPVSLEFVLTLVLNVVNQVIVGALGATAIAAVGFANSLILIFILTLGALGTSAGILVARSHGGGRQGETDHVVSTASVVAVALSAVAAVPLVIWADDVMRLAGASATVTAAGSQYLALMAAAGVPTVLGAVLSMVLRSTGHPRSPMVATLVTAAVSVPLAYGLIFGVGVLPRLGVAGAGWAALTVALAKVAILGMQAFRVHRVARPQLPGTRAQWRAVLVPLLVLALPLAVTQVAWTLGTFLYNVVFQRLGDEALAAAQIVHTLESIFIVGSIGLMSAVTVLVGRSVGRGDVAGAQAWAARVARAGVATGVVFGALFAASILALGVLFDDVGSAVHRAAAVGIAINAAFQVVKVRNMILGGGLLPSGNDVKGVIMGDAVGAFAVGLPLAVALGLFTPLGIVGVFAARIAEEVVKVAIFSWRRRRLDWDALAAPGRPPRPRPGVAADPAPAAA